MERVIIYGGGGHARVVADVVESAGRLKIVGVVTGRGSISRLTAYPVLPNEEAALEAIAQASADVVLVAIGDNHKRCEVADRLRARMPELRFGSAVHARAALAPDVSLGAGVVVMAGAVINVAAQIGDLAIINTGAIVEHECRIGRGASIGPGAALGGNTTVGEGSAISLGASVIHGISIGAHTVVGAGAVVVADLPDCVVAHGVPARVARPRVPGDDYL